MDNPTCNIWVTVQNRNASWNNRDSIEDYQVIPDKKPYVEIVGEKMITGPSGASRDVQLTSQNCSHPAVFL